MTDLLPTSFDDVLKLLTACGAFVTFIWGVFQWRRNEEARREQHREEVARERKQEQDEAAKALDHRRVEAQKPFLELQMRLYNDVMEIAAIIPVKLLGVGGAKGADDSEVGKWVERFWMLYYGRLAMVQNRAVAREMENYSQALNALIYVAPPVGGMAPDGPAPAEPADEALPTEHAIRRLQQACLKLAEAVRGSLDESWGINVWTSQP